MNPMLDEMKAATDEVREHYQSYSQQLQRSLDFGPAVRRRCWDKPWHFVAFAAWGANQSEDDQLKKLCVSYSESN